MLLRRPRFLQNRHTRVMNWAPRFRPLIGGTLIILLLQVRETGATIGWANADLAQHAEQDQWAYQMGD